MSNRLRICESRLALVAVAAALLASACHPFESVDDYRVDTETLDTRGDATVDPGDVPDFAGDGDGTLACQPPLLACDGDCIDVGGTRVVACPSCDTLCPIDACGDAGCACPELPNIADCTLPSGTTLSCIDLDTTDNHCGACNNRCGRYAGCEFGECVCDEEATQCGQRCVDLATNAANCGGCGNGCAATETCIDGACVLRDTPCAPGTLDCDSAVEGCETADNTHQNCGACGARCPADHQCQAGMCTACPTGFLDCTGADASGEDFAIAPPSCSTPIDDQNCGGCGLTCPASAFCDLGEGRCSCGDTTLRYCGDAGCIDTQKDPAHCGQCDIVCPQGVACESGSCGGAPVCPACGPLEECDPESGACVCAHDCDGTGICTDIAANIDHCGACFAACADGEYCKSGGCAECTAGFLECDGVIEDEAKCETPVDDANCGGCGVACDGAMICDAAEARCVQCLDDGDCPGGDFCDAQGFCQTDVMCENDGQCPGARCCAGTCEPIDESACASCTSPCSAGEVCDQLTQTCVECLIDAQCALFCDPTSNLCVECLSNSDCGGENCVAGACEGIPAACINASTCGGDQLCCGDVCTPQSSTNCGGCGVDCPTGQICQGGSCTICTANNQCGPNGVCDNGVCLSGM